MRSRVGTVPAAVVVCVLVAAACGAGTHLAPDAAADSQDAGVDATADAEIDSGLAYDCAAACSRDPPICSPPEGSTPCLEDCRIKAIAHGCVLGENLRLLRCLEEHPGACEQGFDGPCAAEWVCYNYCQSDSWVVCRPPR